MQRLSYIKKRCKYIEKNFEPYSLKTWSPNVEDMSHDELKLPDSVTFFLKPILKPFGDRTPNISRIVDCISQDIISNILGQKTALPKHFLLGLGLQSLVGSRKVIAILHKFGHCVS